MSETYTTTWVRHRFLWGLCLGLAWFASYANAGPKKPKMLAVPHPAFSAKDVIHIQLKALEYNNYPSTDAGIAITYRFASPANKRFTGPLKRFIKMLHSPAYEPMLGHKSASVGRVMVQKDKARALVILRSAQGEDVGYLFVLGKQKKGLYKDCWMTEAVMRLKLKERNV